MHVLLVDDEAALRRSVARSLRFEGHHVTTGVDGCEALELLADSRPDVVVLDVMMPRMDGIEACRRLRAAGDLTPLLVLTARDAVRDRVAGLDAGADDYLVKPFAHEELLARLRALGRRGGARAGAPVLSVGPVRLDPSAWQASVQDHRLTLTRTEFALLEVLMRHPDQVLTRGQLYDHVWERDLDESSNSLEVYVGYLRRKLERAGAAGMIQTVRGVGYVMRRP